MEDKMEIKSLKDLKIALKDIPDETLEDYGFQVNPEGDDENSVQLMCWDAEDPHSKCSEDMEKYPQLEDINYLIRAIIKQEKNFDEEENYEDMISSKDYGKDKVSSPSQELNQTLIKQAEHNWELLRVGWEKVNPLIAKSKKSKECFTTKGSFIQGFKKGYEQALSQRNQEILEMIEKLKIKHTKEHEGCGDPSECCFNGLDVLDWDFFKDLKKQLTTSEEGKE
jgi:hypothetical protein